MKSFIEQAQFYAEYHQNIKTRYTHMAGVPLIILAVMIFLGFIKIIMPTVFATNLACITTLIALIYYFRLNWQLALALTPIMLILLLIASWFSQAGPTPLGIWAFVIFFIVGWGLQFYGHYLEGKKPAFMDNLCQAFIAPLFLVAELFFMAGMMPALKEQIYGVEKKPL
ncbi:transmembrane protein [Legionella wadsworthii]|uniref:Transmembrane protein n=1 Tax=Legionella wadsworthii TaxID=28088 RepID=A0A378LLG3_9GAMM|nr:Mpo1-like protein [Legionella wadsworthii]STY27865.1 transmembrane protein [Legionella wadsworthii]